MMTENIEGIKISPLKIISDHRGSVMHMLRSDSENFDKFGEVYFSTIFEDKIVGEILYNAGINLFHDSRLLFSSPYKQTINNPSGKPINFIGNKDSFLAVQHYCDGHMKELMHLLSI